MGTLCVTEVVASIQQIVSMCRTRGLGAADK